MGRSEAERAGGPGHFRPAPAWLPAGRACAAVHGAPEDGGQPCPGESAAEAGECRTGRGPDAGCAAASTAYPSLGPGKPGRKPLLRGGAAPGSCSPARTSRPRAGPNAAPVVRCGRRLPAWPGAGSPRSVVFPLYPPSTAPRASPPSVRAAAGPVPASRPPRAREMLPDAR